MFKNLWTKCIVSDKSSVAELVKTVCSNEKMWGEDLNKLPGFAEKVTDHLYNIVNNGMQSEINALMA